MINLQKGVVYKSRYNGMVEYKGLDRFCGETTYMFRRLSIGDMTYIRLDQIDDFLEPQETMESLKQQRDELLVALEQLREAFVMAAGNKSPFAKCALQVAGEAIAKAKGGAS